METTEKIIMESPYKDELTDILAYVDDLLEQEEIQPNETQRMVLTNHLNEMIKRAKESELIPSVDKTMFAEVSKESLKIAKKLVEKIGNLPEDEIYILSIHFESAKQGS